MENTGIHRAKTWQMALFALNNTSTNLWLVLLNFVAYYLTGYVGVAVVMATSIMTFMRIWDAITDPIMDLYCSSYFHLHMVSNFCS